MRFKIFLIALLYFYSPFSSTCQNIQLDTTRLLTTIKKITAMYHVPDLAIAITQDDSIIFRFDKNIENKNKNYIIGSCSKSFTALSVLVLAEKGLINIDTPVKKYLPWFTLADTTHANQITVRDLLNQTSGIGREYGYFDYPSNDLNIYEKQLANYLKTVKTVRLTNKTFNYSNLNYLVLGLIINKLAKEPYSAYLTNNVLAQIGMDNTFANFTNNQSNNLIQPFQYLYFSFPTKSKTYNYSDFSVPPGRISSNVNDLSKYLNFMLHQAVTLKKDTLLNVKNYETLITPVADNYAMGWLQNNYHGTNFINHLGLNENYSAALALCPEKKMGIVILSNINSLEFCNEIQYAILSQVIDKPYTPAMSQELFRRKAVAVVILLLFSSFLFNFFRWKKSSFKFGMTLKPFPVVRFIIGIILSAAGLFLLPKMNAIPFIDLVKYQPDFGFGLIAIALLGISSSFIRNLGSIHSKT